MQIVRDLAGYSMGRSDLVRRAMAKKKHDVMAKEKEYFIHGKLNDDGTIDVPGAVRLGDRPVAVGDTYDGENFYHAGAEVLTPLEAAQAEAAAYKAALETLGVNTEEAADDAQ